MDPRDEADYQQYLAMYPGICQRALDATQEQLADRLFAAQCLLQVTEALFALTLTRIGVTFEYADTRFDDYDSSFELQGIEDTAAVLTPEQREALRAMGFRHYWLCYTDGSERYCSGELKASPVAAIAPK